MHWTSSQLTFLRDLFPPCFHLLEALRDQPEQGIGIVVGRGCADARSSLGDGSHDHAPADGGEERVTANHVNGYVTSCENRMDDLLLFALSNDGEVIVIASQNDAS